MSVAYSHTAGKESVLATAERFLDDARRREDFKPDIRFECHALSLEIARLSLERFGSNRATLNSVAASIELGSKLPLAVGLFNSVPGEPLKEVRKWVTRQAFINVASLALMAELDSAMSALRYRKELLDIMNLFSTAKLAPDKDGRYRDELSDFLYWAMVVLFDNLHDAAAARDELLRVNLERFGRDAVRLSAFRDLCVERMTRHSPD